jgi:hypothetical protein
MIFSVILNKNVGNKKLQSQNLLGINFLITKVLPLTNGCLQNGFICAGVGPYIGALLH